MDILLYSINYNNFFLNFTSSGKAINISNIITLTLIDDCDREFLNVLISCGMASGQ